MDKHALQELIDKCLTNLEYTDTFLVDSKINGNKIEIFLDSDTGISFETCHRVSRLIEAEFDESKVFGESYILEVSSPGVGSPLKLLRQYPKNIGRTIEVKTADKSVRGTLTKVENGSIFVEYETKVKEGKKNKKLIITDEILYDNILESKIKIKF